MNFEKTFDSVDREGVWMSLRRRGIPNKFVEVIKSTYNGENEAASFGLKIHSGKSMSIVNSSTSRQPRPNAIVLNVYPG